MRTRESVPAREASSMITSCPRVNVVPWSWWLVHHLAVFSVAIPRSSASTWAATADGASPTTDPLPCSASHAFRSALIAVVLPAPAGQDHRDEDRKSTRLNSSHVSSSYAVFCLNKKQT